MSASGNAATMRISTALTVTGLTVGAAALGYAMYFDQRRRTDPAFRKLLRKQSKQTHKQAKREKKAAEQEENVQIDAAVREVSDDGTLPTGVQEREG